MEPILHCLNVRKHFGGIAAVDGVTCTVSHGEIKAVIGPNGAGKTTLFNLIAGFLRPEKGSMIYFEGSAIAGAKPNLLCRRGLARTFQIAKPFPSLTVLQNVIIGALTQTSSTKIAKEHALETLEHVGLGPWADTLAEVLPIGNRKRLELARVLATKPRLIMLDEIMGGLRPSEISQLVDLLHKIRGDGVTIVMIEHVLSAVMSLADNILVMDRGKVLTHGLPDEVMKNDIVVEAYLGHGIRRVSYTQ